MQKQTSLIVQFLMLSKLKTKKPIKYTFPSYTFYLFMCLFFKLTTSPSLRVNTSRLVTLPYVVIKQLAKSGSNFNKSLNSIKQFSKTLKKKKMIIWSKKLKVVTSKKTIKFTKKKKRKTHVPSIFSDILQYLPLSQLINSKQFVLISHNIMESANQKKLDKLVRDALRAFFFLKFNRIAMQLVSSIYMCLIYKDVTALSIFIKKTFQNVHYSKHNTYFTFAGYLVKQILGPQLEQHNALGIKLVFKGKLGVGGNSRKSSHKYNYGMNSSSSKYIKLSRVTQVIRTKTGSIGFSLQLAW